MPSIKLETPENMEFNQNPKQGSAPPRGSASGYGRPRSPDDQVEFSLSLLIGFYSMLRTGELLGLSSIFNERTFPGRCHLSWADKGR